MSHTSFSHQLPTLESLKISSLDFAFQHGLTEYELDEAHRISAIFQSRLLDHPSPQLCDVVTIKNSTGTILAPYAHLERITPTSERPYLIITNPGIPYILRSEHSFTCDTCGGPWTECYSNALQPTGVVMIKRIRFWGRKGAVAAGAVYLDVPVREWVLIRDY